MISPTEAVGVPRERIEVATYGQKLWMTGSTVIEIKQLVNFIDCVKELYKIYKTTADWKVPKEVLAVVRKVPNLGKKSLAVAKREGLCFVSVYLLYRTVDLYDRAMNLNIDFQMYRKEFESLQIELQQVIHLIHEELLPNWRHLSTGVLRKITLDVDEKLSRYHAELMQLLQHIDADIKKGRLGHGIAWAFAFQLGSAALCGVSALVGNVPGAISAFVASFTGLAGVRSFALTVQQLESLQNDVEGTLIEIEECRFLLQQKLLYSEIFVFLFNVLFLVSVIALFKLNLPQPLSMEAQGGNN